MSMRPRATRSKLGFSLIELMIVVAVLAVVAMIAIPKFAGLIVKAKEATVKGNLGAVRGAFRLALADNEGNPIQLSRHQLKTRYLAGDYPSFRIPTWDAHDKSSLGYDNGYSLFCPPPTLLSDWTASHSSSFIDPWGMPVLTWETKPTAWVSDPVTAQVVIHCAHTDSGGRVWSTW
jgi:prepilin-type N-terminal cleavage/methylation domain-containing protein